MSLRIRTLFTLVAAVLGLALADDATYLYKGTRICTKEKTSLCLSYDYNKDLLILSNKHRLRFDIETVERVNMQLNRVYTYAKDQATRKTVKSCLIKSGTGVALAPCDTNDEELVLAVETPAYSTSALVLDEFQLRDISYLDAGSKNTEALCITAGGIAKNSPILLESCTKTSTQEFRARGFSTSLSARISGTTDEVEVTAGVGRLCLSEKSDLCLGVSLTNGTKLDPDVFVQVKNYTKNDVKGLYDLKMRWYIDYENTRIASAAEMNYCMESVYGAQIGENRKGIMQYDDIVHLGYCDAARQVPEDNGGLPSSEVFYTEEIVTAAGSWMEVRTDVPGSNATKCVSIVKCVVHENGQCTKYNSVEVHDVELLQQGAYARLKDCQSETMISQRFAYTSEAEITVPPTNYPTPKPQTPSPTPFPTPATVTNAPTKQPTKQPTKPPTTSEPFPPTPSGSQGSSDDPVETTTTPGTGLIAGLAFVGVFCIAVIVAGIGYYYKNRNQFKGLPEEDENFIARV